MSLPRREQSVDVAARWPVEGRLRHRIGEAVRGIHTTWPRTRSEVLAGTWFPSRRFQLAILFSRK